MLHVHIVVSLTTDPQDNGTTRKQEYSLPALFCPCRLLPNFLIPLPIVYSITERELNISPLPDPQTPRTHGITERVLVEYLPPPRPPDPQNPWHYWEGSGWISPPSQTPRTPWTHGITERVLVEYLSPSQTPRPPEPMALLRGFWLNISPPPRPPDPQNPWHFWEGSGWISPRPPEPPDSMVLSSPPPGPPGVPNSWASQALQHGGPCEGDRRALRGGDRAHREDRTEPRRTVLWPDHARGLHSFVAACCVW